MTEDCQKANALHFQNSCKNIKKKIIDAITRKFFFPADHDILDLKVKIYLEAEAGRLP